MIRPVLALLMATLGFALGDSPWIPLFDGKTLDGWTSADGKPARIGGWVIEEHGVLCRKSKAGDIFTEKSYHNFELRWEWKISPLGNSGVKYRVHRIGKALLGPEYQMLDNASEGQKLSPLHRAAALYDLMAPSGEPRPVGAWNEARVVARGNILEHYLNGALVMKIEMGSEEWRKALEKSKFAKLDGYAADKAGKIMLQDHNSQAWFRKIEIRELPE